MNTRNLMTRDDVLRHLIPTSSPIILDIGSNEGQSIDQFVTVFSDPTIFGFEPIPDLADALRAKYHDRPNIKINAAAVSEKSGTAEFHINDFSASSSLHSMNEEGVYRKIKDVHTDRVLAVDVTSVDEFCQSAGIDHVDFLKIDAQANSAPILRGATDLLKRQAISVMQVEILFHNFYSKTESLYDIDQILYPMGYRLYTFVHTDHERVGEFAYSFKTGEIWYLDAIYVKEGIVPVA